VQPRNFLRTTYIGQTAPPVERNWVSDEEEDRAVAAAEVLREEGGGTWGVVTHGLLALGRLCFPFCLADNAWRVCVVCACVFVFLFSYFSLSFLLF